VHLILLRTKQHLNYKASFETIVVLLILETQFNILSEYILSYEDIKADDTLLLIFFPLYLHLIKINERNQFWEVLIN
jgi:hypothetical protein